VANFLPRSIILTMVVSFSVSFATMYWQRKIQERSVPVPIAEAVPGVAVSTPAAAPTRPPIAEHQEPIALAMRTAASAERPTETVTPDEEAAAEVLPVAFHIRNRRDLNKIDGDIRNITSKPMPITLRAVNSSTQATSEVHFQLAPGERKIYSTDDGLIMQTNDQLIVQSPPYQDRVVRVP
jgi:hypothetical protein